MTPVTLQALRAVMSAEAYDDESREFIENIWSMAPTKTCEGMLGMSFNYDAEALDLLVDLMSKVAPLKAYSEAPPIVSVDDWPILFVPGALHLTGNLPLENTMVVVLGDLVVDGVIGSYRDFEATLVIVKGDIKTSGIEGAKQIAVSGSVTADIIWIDGNDALLKARSITSRILYQESSESVLAGAINAEYRFSASRPVDIEAMHKVLAPEAFIPEPGYVFEGFKSYGCVNRALRLMQRGLAGFIAH